MLRNAKKSGLSKAPAAVVIVIVVAAALVGTALATMKTTTVTQTVTQSATVTSTVTSLQTPTANNTLDLRAYSTVALAVVIPTGHGPFMIGPLADPTIKVKVGTNIKIFFFTVIEQGLPHCSFVITSSKPPYPPVLSQSDVTPPFLGASTPNPLSKDQSSNQFILFFTADKPGTYYYVCATFPHPAEDMYGQFIVEA